MHRLLLVTKEYSEAPTSGGTQRTLAIANQMARLGEVVVVSPQGTWRREQGLVTKAPDLPVQSFARWRTVLAYRSLSGARTAGPLLLQHLHRALDLYDYDVAVIDHTCMTGIADIVANHVRRIVISMHNIESLLMSDRAAYAPNLWTEWAMKVEARLLLRLERSDLVVNAPKVVVSPADAVMVGGRTIVCPNGLFPEQIRVPEEPLPLGAMIFTGALDWEPNVQGIEWFGLTAWPGIRRAFPQARLIIAGRHPHDRVHRIVRQMAGVELVPNPKDMKPYLAEASIGVVPLLAGGGSRLKILEYLAAGLDVVSTQSGAAGLESIPRDLIDVCPDAAIGEAVIQRLHEQRDNRKGATDWVREHYTWDNTLAPMQHLLAS
jgi:glycosyltransferase involved in cell wall biosynthesis